MIEYNSLGIYQSVSYLLFTYGCGTPQGGNRIEIVLSDHYRDYGGMKLDPIVVEKAENQNLTTMPLSTKFL